MDIKQIVNTRLIDLKLEAGNRLSAVRSLAKSLVAENKIECEDKFVLDVMAREAVGSTFCGNYMAIPHGISTEVKEAGLCIGRCDDILWAGEDERVKLVFLLAIPEDGQSPESISLQIDILSRIATLALDDDVRARWLTSDSNDDFLTPLVQFPSMTPPIGQDVMTETMDESCSKTS